MDIELKETIYFINVYTKNEKDDLTEDEKKAFKAVVMSQIDLARLTGNKQQAISRLETIEHIDQIMIHMLYIFLRLF